MPVDAGPRGGDATSPPGDAREDGAAFLDVGPPSMNDAPPEAMEAAPPPPLDASACVCASPPPGWAFIALEASQSDPCPAGYSAAQDLSSSATALPAACKCTCGGVLDQGSCHGPTISVTSGGAGACTSYGAIIYDATGACRTRSISLPAGTMSRATSVPPTSGACSATSSVASLPAVQSSGDARVCAPAANACPAGCVAPPTPPFAACVTQPGHDACPAGFPNSHVLGPIVDGRSCTGCTCSQTPVCTNARMEFFSDSLCASQQAYATADGNCDAVSGQTGNYASVRYDVQLSTGACTSQSPSMPEGGVSIGAVQTVCCP